MNRKIFGMIAAIVLGDGVVKKNAEKHLADGKTRALLDGKLLLNLFHNEGIAFGAGKEQKENVRKLTMGLLAFATGMLVGTPGERKNGARRIGLALLIGGGISNLIDRMYKGYVVDYFSLNIGPFREKLRRVVFNLSDFCILIGAVMASVPTGTKKKTKQNPVDGLEDIK